MELKIYKDTTHSEADNQAIIKLWHLLVPESEFFIPPCTKRLGFIDSYAVNIPMIIEKAIPAFEQTIGTQRTQALLRHCGYGVRFPRTMSPQRLKNEINCLRTIENAQYYLHNFSKLISNLASRLSGAPEAFDTLTKAKYIRAYILFFATNEFFPEELHFYNKTLITDYSLCDTLNKKEIGPEELFLIFSKLEKINTIRFSGIEYELNLLDNKLRKKVFDLSELTPVTYPITESVVHRYKDFREVKIKINVDHCTTSLTFFSVKEIWDEYTFQQLFGRLLVFMLRPLSVFKPAKRTIKTIKTGGILDTEVDYYIYEDEYVGTVTVSGESEIARYMNLFYYMSTNKFQLKGIAYDYDNNKKIENHSFDWQFYHALAHFALQRKYINSKMQIPEAIERINSISLLNNYDDNEKIAVAKQAITDYWHSEKTQYDAQVLADALNIDKKVEKELFGIEEEKTLEEIVLTFAHNNNIDIINQTETLQLIQEVWITNYSDEIEEFGKTKNEKVFKKAIGFDKEFSAAYFNLEDIDIAKIQERLSDLKRVRADEKVMHANALLINLYCYLVEENVPCGPKKRVPARVKSLKPANLKALIA